MTEIPHQPHGEFNEEFNGEDIRNREDWGEICDRAKDIEMRLAEMGAASYADVIDAVGHDIAQLERQIGEKYLTGVAEVVGWAHRIQEREVDTTGVYVTDVAPHDELIGDVSQSDTEEGASMGRYEGCDVIKVNGRWRVALNVDFTDATDVEEPGLYGFLIAEGMIVELSLYPDHEDDVVFPAQLVQEAAEEGQAIVASPEFMSATFDDQCAMLKEIAANHDSALSSHVRGVDVVVSVTGYYEESLLMPGELFPVELDDDEGVIQLGGILSEGFVYPELEKAEWGVPLTAENFFMADGAPCMILTRKNDEGVVMSRYYIPAQDVDDISLLVINPNDEPDGEL